jgi:cysteine desulfurase
MNIYLDNAATTKIDPEVIRAMLPVLENVHGNPSSIHKDGREARAIIEQCRKDIAAHFNASPSEIFFTSGGTEADNMILRGAVNDLGIERIITSPMEHHAVLHTVEFLKEQGVELLLVKGNEKGQLDMEELKAILPSDKKTLLSLMHANNEVGNLIPLAKIGALCKEHGVLFHSDTVQTMGHYRFDLEAIHLDFATCSAHKLHGPKGIGFIYIRNTNKLKPMLTGGAQERNMRAGTENIYGIVGLAKSLELAYSHLEEHEAHIREIKGYMIEELKRAIPEVKFNGDCCSEDSLYTVLNVSFPPTEMNEMFLFNLDIAGISASGGSACSSGTQVGSHVLQALQASPDRPSIRFSFSRYNSKEDIDKTIAVLKKMYA